MSALAEPAESTSSPELLWGNVLQDLRTAGNVYPASQLEQLLPIRFAAGIFTLGVADRFFRDWIDDHYRKLVEETLSRTSGVKARVEFEIVEKAFRPPTPPVAPPVNQVRAPARLNERFTFETYVVADSNQLPAAAAMAVAESPGKAYNPLFIYGVTGLGKTHLLHAVGNRILKKSPESRIVYLSSEEFTNQFIESVRDGRMTEFRKRFREDCDALLIDDIQFLGKKQETQNEFFYTFNALHQVGKAIVLTSDMDPSEIPGLEERLRSRFKMGLITDVQEPNYEMRIAILKKKAASDGFDLPDKVAHYIARHVVKNVRELEGALVKLSAVHSLTRQAVTEEFAEQVLKDLLPQRRPLDVDTIQREAARYYKLSLDELRSTGRTKPVAHARQVAMYLCRTLTGASFPEIGNKFSKDHSTVISSVRKVEAARENDDVLVRELGELIARLGAT